MDFAHAHAEPKNKPERSFTDTELEAVEEREKAAARRKPASCGILKEQLGGKVKQSRKQMKRLKENNRHQRRRCR